MSLDRESDPDIFTGSCEMVGARDPVLGLGSSLSLPAPLWPWLDPSHSPCGGEEEWAQGQAGVWMVASPAGSLLFNMKSRACNCIKTCIIIPEEGEPSPW